MRKLILTLALAPVLAFAGCAGTATGGNITISDVQNAAVTACGFLPTASTVASIIATLAAGPIGTAAVTTASDAASAICAAVTNMPKAARRGGAAPIVVFNGVKIPVHGKFVQ